MMRSGHSATTAMAARKVILLLCSLLALSSLAACGLTSTTQVQLYTSLWWCDCPPRHRGALLGFSRAPLLLQDGCTGPHRPMNRIAKKTITATTTIAPLAKIANGVQLTMSTWAVHIVVSPYPFRLTGPL